MRDTSRSVYVPPAEQRVLVAYSAWYVSGDFSLRVVEIGADRHDADSMGWCRLNLSSSDGIGPNTNTEPHEKSDDFIHGGSR